MNISNIDTEYNIPATNAAHRTRKANPIQVNITDIPTDNACGITKAVAIAPSIDSIPVVTPAKYVIKYIKYDVPSIPETNNNLLFFIKIPPYYEFNIIISFNKVI